MLPQAFLERMEQMLGDEYPAFVQSYEKERYQALRINPLKADRDTFLKKAPFVLRPVAWEPNGFYYAKEDAPGKHPYHAAGVYYIQEPSAMAPAAYLDAQPGEKILDLCAAPGGKSTQIAAAMRGDGLLISNEIHPARARILSENIERMGIRNAMVTNESPQSLAKVFEAYFDRIMVDAPCSGEGMFRKNETACEEWSPENVRLCAERQDEILDCAAKMLRPGGRLVYSTCTFAEEEDEGSIRRFLERHSEFKVTAVDGAAMGLGDCEGNFPGTVRLWPHKIKGEGHFAAVLIKAGDTPEGWNGSISSGETEKTVSEKELEEYFAFCRENLKGTTGQAMDGARYIRFGDNLYLAPKDMPGLKGLKVLRPGLHLGEIKKNRFEPSHALALALSPEDTVHVWNLRSEELATAYLNGLTFSAEGEKGWYLICVDGFSLGWGKLAGGIMKNHYPKGLRVNR